MEQKDAVSLVLASVPAIKNLSAQQWSTAADMTKTLKPFLAVTELMSGASYPTLSMVLPVVDGLLHLLRSAVDGLDVLHDVLVRQVQERFGNLFDEDELCVATVVDPRFKLVPFDTDERRERDISATLSVMARESSVSSEAVAAAPPPSQDSSSTSSSIWAKLDATAARPAMATSSSADVCRNQLDSYLPGAGIARDGNPLTWWAANRSTFPVVASVARKMLAVPATSVASERLFSKAGDVITKKRNHLSASKADKLCFLMENL